MIRNGSGASAFAGLKITVWSFIPSRIGIITLVSVKSDDSEGDWYLGKLVARVMIEATSIAINKQGPFHRTAGIIMAIPPTANFVCILPGWLLRSQTALRCLGCHFS